MLGFRFSRALAIKCPSFCSHNCIRQESSLSTLRKKTGYALNLCKKALTENQNDLSAAENWLKEEAAKNGWQKAASLGTRPTAEGLIGVFVTPNNESGVLLEVNCQSDFVSRNSEFRQLVSNLTKTIADATIVQSSSPSAQVDIVKKYLISDQQLEIFQESLVSMITKLGENIKLRRALLYHNPAAATNESNVKLTGYAHAVGGQTNYLNDVHIGKYGTIIAYKDGFDPADDVKEAPKPDAKEESRTEAKELSEDGEEEEEEFEQSSMEMGGSSKQQVARLVAQHIIGLKPTKIRKSEKDLEEEARFRAKGYKVQDDDESLLDQRFLVNDSVTVRQVLKDKDMQIVDFERFECGAKE